MIVSSITAVLATAATMVSAGAIPVRRGNTASITPHVEYSSSVGVVGCKIDTNRVAYWPGSVSCDDICVKLTYGDRSLHVLKIDSSAGAYDISYDAWNILQYGKSAAHEPHMGGGVEMQYEFVDNSECAHILDNGKLPLTAANSMNYLASCLDQPDSWVAKNHKLLNVLDPVCHWGVDEECDLDLSVSNQPSCPSTLGVQEKLDKKVWNIAYGTGELMEA